MTDTVGDHAAERIGDGGEDDALSEQRWILREYADQDDFRVAWQEGGGEKRRRGKAPQSGIGRKIKHAAQDR